MDSWAQVVHRDGYWQLKGLVLTAFDFNKNAFMISVNYFTKQQVGALEPASLSYLEL